VLWRVANLGYSQGNFQSIDREIASAYNARDNDPSRTDRYGKKYSWISFFEMCGMRRVKGELARWSEDRPSDADIDPSFPKPPRSWMLPRSGIFESGPADYRAWLRRGTSPNYESLLRRDEVAGIPGEWVLIEGFVEESAKPDLTSEDKRRAFSFLWARLVQLARLEELLRLFYSIEYPGNNAIPEYGSDYYAYASEIPWSTNFAPGLRNQSGNAVEHIQDAFTLFDPEAGWQKGIPVEIPIHRWSWEPYHSTMNEVTGVFVPAPALCRALQLVNHSRQWDLFDPSGRRATVFLNTESEETGSLTHLLYLR